MNDQTMLVPKITPNYNDIVDLVLSSITNENTRRGCKSDLQRFMDWWGLGGQEQFTRLNKWAVNQFKQDLIAKGVGTTAVNRNLSHVKKLVREAEDNGMIDPVLARGIMNVQGVPVRGDSLQNWLTKEQAQKLLDLPDGKTTKGLRDEAMLSVLLGCGLRRDELVNLVWEDVQQRDGRWVVLVRKGKRNKRRIVPMAPWTKVTLDCWLFEQEHQLCEPVQDDDFIFMPVKQSGMLADKQLSPDGVYTMVRNYGKALGVDISPHDLRRTYAKLARKGGAYLEQIQYSLGHASVETTMKYIGEEQDFNSAPCDVLGLGV